MFNDNLYNSHKNWVPVLLEKTKINKLKIICEK